MKLAEFWCFVVAGVLISVASTYFFVKSELSDQYADAVAGVKDEADKRVAEVQEINIGLMTTLQEKIVPMVETQAELTDKLDRTTDQVATAASKSTQAASVASRAASQAGQAVKKSRQPAGSIRQVPTTEWRKPRCFMGKDVYGDPCN